MTSSQGSSLTNNLPACFSEKWCSTQVKVNASSYTWTIRNFAYCREQVGEYLESSSFATGENENIIWKLRAFPNGDSDESKNYVSLYLRLLSSNTDDVRVQFILSVLDAEQNKKETVPCHSLKKFAPGAKFGYAKFIKKSILLETANGLLNDKNLKIYCEIYVYEDSVNTSGQSIYYCKVPKCTLPNDFINMLNNSKFSDVILNVSGKEIPAHKAILSSRSPVFAAMFEHDTMEKKTNRVEIVDIDYKVFREILRFIYTGLASHLDEIAMDLLPAADKYALDRLKAMCEDVLCSKISVEIACNILVMADMHGANQLKVIALDYISKHAIEVTATDGWKLMVVQHPHLVTETVKMIAAQQTSPPHKKTKLF